MAAAKPFIAHRRVEFADTDSGGIVHFSRFFVFMETAEHEYLRSLGINGFGSEDGRTFGWPRVAAHCDYKSPARFGDQLTIAVSIRKVGNSSVRWGFAITRDGEAIADGELTTVCVTIHPGGRLEPTPVPAAMRS